MDKKVTNINLFFGQMENPFLAGCLQIIRKHELMFPVDDKVSYNIYVPVTELLPEIYEALGASSFEELFPTTADFESMGQLLIVGITLSNQEFLLKEKLSVASMEEFFVDIVVRNQPRELDIAVLYVEGLPLTAKVADEIRVRLIMRGGKGDEYAKMPKDVFHHLVLTGNLAGKDLIAVCGVNRDISRKCDADDQLIFRRLLLKEFGLKKYDRSPRELYRKMYELKEGWKILKRRLDDFEELQERKLIYAYFGFFQFDIPADLYSSALFFANAKYWNSYDSPTSYQIHAERVNLMIKLTERGWNGYWTKDPEDIWFDEVRPEIEENFQPVESHFEGTSAITFEDIDNIWDDAPKVLGETIKLDNRRLRELVRKNYRETVQKFEKQTQMSDEWRKKQADQQKFISDFGLSEISERELNFLLDIHELVMDGTISITFPFVRLE